MKKILILGANNSQVQLIRAAKEEGYYVVACDYAADNPGIPFVDKHYPISYLDREAVLSIAREEKVDGVIGNTDASMPVVAYVANQLGLVGDSPQSVEAFLSKSAFRELQRKAGLYHPQHVESDDLTNVAEAIKGFDYPVIVKPSICSGSKGTTKIYGKQEEKLREAFDLCKEFSDDGKVTIEEYVEMPSLDVIEGDLFVLGDVIIWDGFFNIRRSVLAPMLPMTKTFPATLTDEEFARIRRDVTKLFRAAGTRFGEFNIEMYFTPEGDLFIIENNPRQGGNRIPQLIKQHTGIDFNRLLVTTAVGDNYYFDRIKTARPETNYLSQHIVFSNYDGVLEGVTIDPAIRQYVTGIEITKNVGGKVARRSSAADSIAYVTMEFPDRPAQLSFCGERIEEFIYPVLREKELPVADCSLPYQPIYDFMTGDAYDFFVPKLERVPRTVEGYAEQFSAYGTIAYDVDRKNRITGMVAGYTHNLRIPGRALIAEVYVNREYRKKGLGEQLMRRYIDYCRSIGLGGVWLHVHEDNEPALRLYRNLGFVVDESSNEGGMLKMDLIF